MPPAHLDAPNLSLLNSASPALGKLSPLLSMQLGWRNGSGLLQLAELSFSQPCAEESVTAPLRHQAGPQSNAEPGRDPGQYNVQENRPPEAKFSPRQMGG
ncbi:hypothetical protein ON010_g8484 [Phytophthora cinnamomi]|nr:hypothetical protein ON010_g8484 [Phytophthora cinnamomi]